ncbi:MAG: DinB family protein [archaeon]|nr:DinB family protein [archaeon]
MPEESDRKELEAVRDWFEYNTFVRKRYLDYISKLPENVITKDRGASFPSILDILTHILDVYKSWFHVYETGTGKDLPELKGLSLTQVKDLESEIDQYISKFMRNTTSKDLYNTFQFTTGEGEEKRIVKRKLIDLLWHLVEEELQHRGELNALLWQDDIDPPVTSWGRWMNERAKS